MFGAEDIAMPVGVPGIGNNNATNVNANKLGILAMLAHNVIDNVTATIDDGTLVKAGTPEKIKEFNDLTDAVILYKVRKKFNIN